MQHVALIIWVLIGVIATWVSHRLEKAMHRRNTRVPLAHSLVKTDVESSDELGPENRSAG